ncbi:MAG: DUF4153 domain-containing protein, partial [Hyphomonadaceae bacterium]
MTNSEAGSLADPKLEMERGERAAWRIIIGVLAGLFIAGLFQFGIFEPRTRGTFAFILMLAPFVLLGGVGRFRLSVLALWFAAAFAICWAIGAHAAGDEENFGGGWYGAFVPTAALLFSLHHLIEGGDRAGRVFASYPTYFDIAWRDAVQLALSIAFLGVFWILLGVGVLLFGLVGVTAFQALIASPVFIFPASGAIIGLSVHVTDTRDALVRSVRMLALTLFSWLLPVLTLIALAFLLTLLTTGLEPLWATRSAASILLTASAALIVLINATYQDGATRAMPGWQRVTAIAAAAALVIMVAIAAYAIALRVGQYGLTPERVIAIAATALAALYAVGYLAAALWPGRAFRMIEPVNIAAAVLGVIVVIGLYTPIADPARISVADQVRRLERDAVAAERFDYAFLRFASGRYGREALEALTRHDNVAIAERARRFAAYETRSDYIAATGGENADAPDAAPLEERITMRTPDRTLPASFLAHPWEGSPELHG